MAIATSLGFPRIGDRRALKTALEAFWAGRTDEAALLGEAARLRAAHWDRQRRLGISHVPSGDFALYDHVLDTACMLGAIPPGYGWSGGPVSLATSFALARGSRGTEAEAAAGIAPGLPALEMTKWFDTNYHYLVPVLAPGQRFTLTGNHPRAAFEEALARGVRTRPVILGPVTFLKLAKSADGSDTLGHLDALLPVYAGILAGLAEAGAHWVQIDEPCLALDLSDAERDALIRSYAVLREAAPGLELLVASYFGPLADNLATALALPVSGLHLDLVRGAEDLDAVLEAARDDLWLSLGIVDGRNVWRTDLRAALATLQRVAERRGTRRLMVAPSCSLLHVPIDLEAEDALDPEVKSWLAFATQKLAEIATLTRALDAGEEVVAAALKASDDAVAARRSSARVHDQAVAARLAAGAEAPGRAAPYPARRAAQRRALDLPPFPTTTIGSFPQTEAVRRLRADHAAGRIDDAAYEAAMQRLIAEAVAWQEEIGLDVLVHGEFERNDMVKYFGERLAGFAFTKHGWVQSYGSRCVAPPIIWGDVSRPAPITVTWTAYAQSLTSKPVKGMLTGPVTMLQWSFVRDDLPRQTVCRQLALAIRDEVADLQAAGIRMVQIDEPAFREGLPLRRGDRQRYLDWAVACFRIAAGAARDETQVHTHMCYSEFNDIIAEIAALDADVISIETARSRMELLDAFAGFAYPNEIGPGVFDIHSPRVADAAEMLRLMRIARGRIPAERLWVNPDCGLKTRRWEEVRPALANMVAAARLLRAELAAE
jgi:5-methyltetrahydropteroyltriglutamate--homocysteine methyltransferase